MTDTLITIDMDRKCAECGKGGAADSGICLRCTEAAMSGKPLRSAVGRAVQQRIVRVLGLTTRVKTALEARRRR